MTTPPRKVIRSRPRTGWSWDTGVQMMEDGIADHKAEEAKRIKRLRKAMALNDDHFGFTKEERYQLAQMLPGVDKDYEGSWKTLSPEKLHDLITMMEGFIWISYMYSQRSSSFDQDDD